MKVVNTRVTIRDIAIATGLHFTTVALCLRDSPRLRVETRKKVQETAKNLGYKPDPMVSALTVYRQAKRMPNFQSVLAWINNWPNRAGLMENPCYRRYYEGAMDRAQRLGYLIEEFWLREPRMTPDKLARILKSRNIQGLLLAPQPPEPRNFPLNFTDFSAVAFGYSIQPSVFNVVTSNHFRSMNTVMSKLVELGYRKIGLTCVSALIDKAENEKLENGYMGSFMLSHHWKYPHLEYLPPFFFSHDPAKPSFKEWLDTYKPQVVIGWDGTLSELRSMGYQIPQQIGFVSMDVNSTIEEISGINQNDFMIGQKGVDVLVGMIGRGERGPASIPICTLVDSEWLVGKTLRKQNSVRKSTPRDLQVVG